MRKKFAVVFTLLFTILSFLNVGCQSNEKFYDSSNIPFANKSNSIYNNKFLSWGILRKPNGEIPDADPGAPELIRKYGGIYLGDINKKEIYLTFNMGFENGYTEKILDVLKENNVKAVFFITGYYLAMNESLVKRMLEEGHEVGNHSQNHLILPNLNDKQLIDEVVGLNNMFFNMFGKYMNLFRSPKGDYSERTLKLTQELGYTNIFWSFAYHDWDTNDIRGAGYTYKIVMENLHNGAILLLHAVSKDNADAMDMIIKGAREKGYEFGIPGSFLNNTQ